MDVPNDTPPPTSTRVKPEELEVPGTNDNITSYVQGIQNYLRKIQQINISSQCLRSVGISI